MSSSDTGFDGWAILEILGHRRLGGRLSEATIAGAAFVRIDLPDPEDSSKVAATQFYAPSSVYAITPTTAEIACEIARSAPHPVTRWDLRALLPKTPPPVIDQPGDDEPFPYDADEIGL